MSNQQHRGGQHSEPTRRASPASTGSSGATAERSCPACGPVPPIRLPDGRLVPGVCGCDRDQREALYLEELRARALMVRREEAGVPALLAGATVDNFEPRPGTGAALEATKAFLAAWPRPRRTGEGLLFVGPPGNGKSHLAAALVGAVTTTHTAYWAKVLPLMDRFDATFSREARETSGMIYRKLRDVDLLIMDDLGASKYTESREERIFRLVDERVDARRPIVATSNCSMAQLEENVGLRTIDRLVGACDCIALTATSYRQERAELRMAQAREGASA